jgi:aspartate/methionine/tyrosine aminotransferase
MSGWIPQGGFFAVFDVSKIEVKEKYQYGPDGQKFAHDFAVNNQIAHEKGVLGIPCSIFCENGDITYLLRYAICKKPEDIKEAARRFGIKTEMDVQVNNGPLL